MISELIAWSDTIYKVNDLMGANDNVKDKTELVMKAGYLVIKIGTNVLAIVLKLLAPLLHPQ